MSKIKPILIPAIIIALISGLIIVVYNLTYKDTSTVVTDKQLAAVTQIYGDGFDADMLEETFVCTAFGELATNAAVNLERALRASDRMGGHIVQGHVDAKAQIVSITPQERDWRVRLSCSGEAVRYVVNKGSVALDGISLTVSHLPARGLFEVDIIPTTWRETSLRERKPGDHVNLETDIIGRFVEHFLTNGIGGAGNGIDETLLRKAGFLP